MRSNMASVIRSLSVDQISVAKHIEDIDTKREREKDGLWLPNFRKIRQGHIHTIQIQG
jgi:hypothetical protein